MTPFKDLPEGQTHHANDGHDHSQTTSEWEKEAEGMAMILEDGSLKDCKVYHEAIVTEFIPTLLSQAEQRERERKIREDYGFKELVEMAQTMLGMVYPKENFDGSSGDIGPVFVSKLRDALASLTPPQESSKDKPQ